jgi:hypothetical protein
MPDDSTEMGDVLQPVWALTGQAEVAADEDCSPTKVCKNMKGIGFDGWAEPGTDLRAAWRDLLAREGKLAASAPSIRDLVLGPSESR